MNTERDNWTDIKAEDAMDAELRLVHAIMGERPKHITPEQWRENMRACAGHIRTHVALQMPERPSLAFDIGEHIYFVRRDSRRGNGWAITSTGVLCDFISSDHFGDVAAFRKIAQRLEDIEQAWTALQKI